MINTNSKECNALMFLNSIDANYDEPVDYYSVYQRDFLDILHRIDIEEKEEMRLFSITFNAYMTSEMDNSSIEETERWIEEVINNTQLISKLREEIERLINKK